MNLRELSLPTLASSKEFEALCLAVYQRLWRDHNAQLNGATGQSQCGVDIFGRDAESGDLHGVQCKVRAGKDARLTFAEIEDEIAKAEKFEPKLKHFILATTASRNATLQTKVRVLSERRQGDGLFSIHVVAWDDLVLILDRHLDIAAHFYPFLKPQLHRQDNSISELPSAAARRGEDYLGVLSHRMNYAMKLLNEGRRYESISVSRVAEMLGAERVSDVSKYFDGQEEPTIQFMREFAARFGINADWMIHGEDEPFYCAEPIAFSPLDALPFLESWAPEEVFIVRSKSECGECAIIVKLDDWKYVTMNGIWHVSSHVGATGRSQLVDLCDLFLKILEKRFSCRGFAVDESTFYSLNNGEIYPGTVLEGHNGNADWWLALLDVDHKNPGARFYKQWHGQPFLDAQRILRECLSPEQRKNLALTRSKSR